MKIVILVALAVLTGCAHTAAFTNGPPTAIYSSFVPAKDLAFCIADKNHAAQKDRGDGSYVIDVRTIYGGSGEYFVITPKGSGSEVEYRKAKGLLDIKPKWKSCIGQSPS